MAWGMKNVTIMLFGSSIMEGRIGVEEPADRWYELMRAELSRRFPATCFSVRNCAVGGQSLRELMVHLDRDLEGFTPDFCLAMFGWNNFTLEQPERVVTIDEQNRLIDDFFLKIPSSTRIIGVISQPMIDQWHAVSRKSAYDGVRSEYGSVNAYHDLERDNAKRRFAERNVPYLDLNAAMRQDAEKYILHTDGIHLSPDGHRLFAASMSSMLAEYLKDDGHAPSIP